MKIKTMLMGALALACACAFGENTKDGESPDIAVQKLQTCDFLLNKDFKKDAKYYLCLFSASWCPPCRAEMPRIAKTYAETLKDDPNVELIHFSCDQSDEKALSWAKEHDVKFPVVKPNGGNPLDLHTRGIPHLFIVKADGTLIEEGHPMKLFTEEKLNALKAGGLAAPETTTEKTRKAIAKLFPGWSLDSEVPQGDGQPEHSSGFHASHRGRNNIIRLHPMNRETPVVLSRMVKLPDTNPCLALNVASWNDDADFLLSVRVNGKDALTNRLICTSDAVPWEDIVVPLSAWRGSSVKLEIILSANNWWWCEWSHLARVDIIEADGDMSIREGKCEVGGYTWSYRAQNGEATIVAENDGRFSAVSPCPVGGITIPATIAGAKVKHIGRGAFRDCSTMTSVIIPEGVSRIGREAFRDCTGLKSIKIPSSVQIIERDAFAGCNGLASVSIPEGVTSIDRGAFYWCCGLGSIEIPSSVTHIGKDAFHFCLGLSSITIPENVTDIGPQAFRVCKALASVRIPASVTNVWDTAFCDTYALTSFHVDPGNRFYKSENGLLLTKDGTTLVRGVNGDATIPPSVTAIGNCAFEGCVALWSVEIPSGVKSIGSFAFKQCRGMKSVTIPESVTDIGQEAFSTCKNLKSIAIPQGVTVIRNSTFSGSALTEVVIPPNVKVLERGAFSWCGELKSVSFPEGMTSIGRDAFYNCGKLTSLTIPSSVRRVEQGAFHGCGQLANVTMRGERPDAPNNIFQGCGKLKSIHVPAKAKSWAGMKAWQDIPLVFDGQSVNERVDVSTQEMSMVANKLQGCDFLLNKDFKRNAKVYLCLLSASWCGPCRAEMPRIAKIYAETLKDDPDIELIHFSRDQNDEKALAWAKEHDVKFPVVKPNGGNPLNFQPRGIPRLYIVKQDGTVDDEGDPLDIFNLTKIFNAFAKSGEESVEGYTWSYWVRNGEATIAPPKGKYSAVSPRPKGHVAIPEKLGNARVTSIGVRAFSYSSGLTSVTIPEGVTRIEKHAFSSCSGLSKVSLPASLTAIDDLAFSECTALESLPIPPRLKTIGSMAFWRCSNLRSVTIPSGVTSIGSIAFSGCKKLRSVTIPATVTDLGHGAFSECSELKGVDVEIGNGKYESVDGVLYTKGKNALVLCPGGVNSVQVPASVNSIWRYAFQGCDKLEKIVVAEDNPAYASVDGFLLTKDRKTLVACPGALTELKLPSSLTRIESEACARNENLTAVEIPEGVVSIGRWAFNGCSRLKSVQIPTSVVTMDSGVFERCLELTTITIPSNVRHLGGWTFDGCKGLRSVTLFEGLENIGDYEFWSCTGLTSVVIPASVKRIGRHAFIGCSGLTSLTMSGERPNAPNNIFQGCGKLKAIHVPANAKSWAGMKDWFGIPLVFDAK